MTKQQENQLHIIYALCDTAMKALNNYYEDYFTAIDLRDTPDWAENYQVMQDRIFGIRHVFEDALAQFDGIEGVETDRTRGIKELAAGMR